MPPKDEDKAVEEETVVVGPITFTKSEVKNMSDGEFEHSLALARQQDTDEGDEQVATLKKFRGKKVKDDAEPSDDHNDSPTT